MRVCWPQSEPRSVSTATTSNVHAVSKLYLFVYVHVHVCVQANYYRDCSETLAEAARGLESRDAEQDSKGSLQSTTADGQGSLPWYMTVKDIQEKTGQHLASVRMLSIVGTSGTI